MAQLIKVGIIGCGGIATKKHMPALAKVKDVEMVAFCDIIPERAERSKENFGTPDAKCYTDYKELLLDTEIDVVHVCTPNRSHSFITVDALEAGKHVMCEKPMAINSAEAKKMLDAAERTGKKLSIGYQSRFRPDSEYLKAESEAGTFGEIYYAKATALRRRAVPTWGVFLNEYEQGGGPLIDIGTHALDLTLWIMNNYKPKYCLGTTYHKLNGNTQTANSWGDWDPEKYTVEDSAFGYVVMENGAVVTVEASWALNVADPREACYMICGDKGGVDTCGKYPLAVNYVKHGRQALEIPNLEAGGAAFYAGASSNPQDIEARIWIDAVKGKGELCVKPEQAMVVTQILEAIYESAKTGKPVFIGE